MIIIDNEIILNREAITVIHSMNGIGLHDNFDM